MPHPTATKRIVDDQVASASAAQYILGPGGKFDVNGISDGFVLDADADTTISADTDDQIDIKVGATDRVQITSSLMSILNPVDFRMVGASTDRYAQWDSSADILELVGTARPRGFNSLSDRFELRWVAGQRGKPGVNGDILSATEATREIADPDFEVLGTNAVSGSVTFYAEGGLLLTTAGAQADSVIIAPHLDANQSAWTQVTWGTDQETVWECLIQTTADITNTTIWAGLKLTNTPVVATDNDQVFFRYETGVNTGKWQAVDSIGGTDTSTDAGVTVAVSTTYHLKIVIDSSRIAKFYINGTLVRTTTALTDAVDLIPYIGVAENNTGATAETLRVFGQAISRNAGA